VGFLTSPLLFLFDEPFDGLDIMQSNELASIMLEESAQMSMIVSSHRMDVIERLADLIIVLRDGRIHAAGSVEEICALLGGHCVVISNSPDHQIPISSLLPSLKQEFYSCLVNQIGNQLLITGNNVDLKTLELYFLKNRLSGLSFSLTRPSLVDAMRYHLNKLN
jgi:ABC-type multidrug transport system ATPase subunit